MAGMSPDERPLDPSSQGDCAVFLASSFHLYVRRDGRVLTFCGELERNREQRPTAGWASTIGSRHFMAQPAAVLRIDVAKRPPEGGEADKNTVQWTVFPRDMPEHACEGRERGRCPAAQAP